MNLRLANPLILDKAELNESSTNVDKSMPRAWQNLRMGTIREFIMYVAGPDKKYCILMDQIEEKRIVQFDARSFLKKNATKI